MPSETRGAKYRAEVLAANDLRPDEKLILDEIAAVIDELDGLPKANVVERRQQRNPLVSWLFGPSVTFDATAIDRQEFG